MKRIINIILAAACILPLSCQKTEEMGTLPAPDGVKAVLSDDEKSIEVTWNPVEGAESYIVHYNVEASNAYMKSGLLEETVFSLADFDKGVTYEFKVRCASNTAVSEFSQVATVSVPKPDGSDPSAYTPEISNVRPGLGWINFTMALPAVTCTYKCYDGETALEAVPELISKDEDAGTAEYSLPGLELGKTYQNLSIAAVVTGIGESDKASFGSVTTGSIEVLTRNPSPRHLAFEWDDVAGNANWTFGDPQKKPDPNKPETEEYREKVNQYTLTRTYLVELAKDAGFKDIVYSVYTIADYDKLSVSHFSGIYGAYCQMNWVGQNGSPVDHGDQYAYANTNIVFGQLEPATTYYFRVRNAAGENVPDYFGAAEPVTMNAATGKSAWSKVISATTEDAHAAAGGELLYQGFDDHAIQFDHINCAAGVAIAGAEVITYSYPWDGEWCVTPPSTGLRYDEIGASYTAAFSGGGETELDGFAVYKFNEDIIPSMNGWHCAKACYPQQGALKMGGGEGQKNYIITPPFTDIEANTSVTVSCKAGAAHAESTPAKLHIKVYRAASNSLETIKTIDLPASAYIMSPNNDGYHNVVEMKDYNTDATLQPGDYVMFEAETIKSPATNRLVIDDILIVKK